MFWKNSIQTACEQIYNVIYADKIKEQMMKVIGKKRKKSTVEDVYALKKRMQVEISFPISPFIGADQLYIHYQRGTITWERYQEHACAAAALPHEPLPEPTDPEPSDVTVSKEKPEKEKPEKKKKIEDSDSEEEE